MGRHKEYDRETLIAAAQPLFHAHGYAGTSTQQLVDALGVNRNSMYAEFGSKQGLFDAVLERYDRLQATAIFGGLEQADAGLHSIEALFARFARDSRGPASGLGCLLCNTAVELGHEACAPDDFVPRYFQRVQAAFRHALDRSRLAGELAPGVDTLDHARFFTATALGLFVLVRARTSPAVVASTARVAIAHVEGLRGKPSRAAPAG